MLVLSPSRAVFSWCSSLAAGRGACAGAGRALHGAGAALAAVSGMALVSRALARAARDRAIAALLGAVALGELLVIIVLCPSVIKLLSSLSSAH